MPTYKHWRKGAQAAYEEMSCLAAAGATGEELAQIQHRLAVAHGGSAGTPEDLAGAAGHLDGTAWAEQLLYREDAEWDAALGAEAGM
jgi:hypothetical protein